VRIGEMEAIFFDVVQTLGDINAAGRDYTPDHLDRFEWGPGPVFGGQIFRRLIGCEAEDSPLASKYMHLQWPPPSLPRPYICRRKPEQEMARSRKATFSDQT
jgi:hypothetical protein